MARTVTTVHRTVTITNTATGTEPASGEYNPTLSTTLTASSTETFGEGERDSATTANTCYIDSITDDLVKKYMTQ